MTERSGERPTTRRRRRGDRIRILKALSNNRELYEYLLLLAEKLKDRGSLELGETVRLASRHAASNMSTEFLGESRIALRQVLQVQRNVLTEQERTDLADVLKQLDDALDQKIFWVRGG